MKDLDKASVTRLTIAVLGIAKLILAAFEIELPQDMIDTIVNFVGAGFAVYAGIMNNYVGKKGKAQKATLEENGLK